MHPFAVHAYPKMQPIMAQEPGWHVPFGAQVSPAEQSAGLPQYTGGGGLPELLDELLELDELDELLVPPDELLELVELDELVVPS